MRREPGETQDDEAYQRGYDLKLKVLKNRSDGLVENYALRYEPISRRFYKAGSGSPDKRYSWEPVQLKFAELPNDSESPF